MKFIDYEKALYSVLAADGLKLQNDQRIEKTCIRLLDHICKEFTGRITFHKKAITIRPERSKEGDAMSPKLFRACLDGFLGSLSGKTYD